jgi:hypothetical protein
MLRGTTSIASVEMERLALPRFQGGKRMNDDLTTRPWDEWNDIGGEG